MPVVYEWDLSTPAGHARWCQWRARVVRWEVGRENNAMRPNSRFIRRGMGWDQVCKMRIYPRQKRPDTRLRLLGRTMAAKRRRTLANWFYWTMPLDKRYNW